MLLGIDISAIVSVALEMIRLDWMQSIIKLFLGLEVWQLM